MQYILRHLTLVGIINELKLRCCPHCIPEETWVPLKLTGDHQPMKGKGLKIKTGLTYINNTGKNHQVDFKTRSILQNLFASRFGNDVAHFGHANFDPPRTAFVSRPKCHAGEKLKEGDKDPCEIRQLVVTCGQYAVYTAKLKSALSRDA